MTDPLDFFAEYSGLRMPSDVMKLTKGICPSCSREETLYRGPSMIACWPCYTIRMGYPVKSKPDFKPSLGRGDYAIVSGAETIFYTNLRLFGAKTKPALTKDTGLYELFLDLIRAPRQDSYLLVHFGKPTSMRAFRLNTRRNRDYLFVSGEPMIGTNHAGSIKAWLVRDLLKRYPEMSKKSWLDIIALPGKLNDPVNGEKAATDWEQHAEHNPGIFKTLPEPRTIEAKLLEVAGGAIRGQTRGRTTRTGPRRRP